MADQNIEAIKSYFDRESANSPEAVNLKNQFLAWYSQLGIIDGYTGDSDQHALDMKHMFDTANGSPPSLDTAADLTQQQKSNALATIANSPALTPDQKHAAFAANPKTSATPGVSPNSTDRPTIHLGSNGAAVAEWQGIVGTAADGKFGSNTQKLTIAWQKQHGLIADGVVGPKTWSAAIGQPVQLGPAPSAPVPSVAPAKPQPIPPAATVAPQHTVSSAPEHHDAPAIPGAPPPVPATATMPGVSHSLKRYAASAAAGLGGLFIGGPWVGGAAAVGTFFLPKWRA